MMQREEDKYISYNLTAMFHEMIYLVLINARVIRAYRVRLSFIP